MLKPILSTREMEWILLFIATRQEGYALEIARFFDANYRSVQRQLERLEYGGVLQSRRIGKTRQYRFNPRYPFQEKLVDLINEAKRYYPKAMVEKLDYNRRRPRRQGKPL